MKFFESSRCCCCANLRTGGLIIGYLTIFSCIVSFVLGDHWAKYVIPFLAHGSLLYGIYNKRANWILPSVLLGFFGLILLLLGLVLIPISSLIFIDMMQKFVAEVVQESHTNFEKNIRVMLMCLWILAAFCTVLQWHFTAVLFSLYKSMKGANEVNLNAKNIKLARV